MPEWTSVLAASGWGRVSTQAGVAQLAERQPSKLNVAGSNPVSRSTPRDVLTAQAARNASIEARIPEASRPWARACSQGSP